MYSKMIRVVSLSASMVALFTLCAAPTYAQFGDLADKLKRRLQIFSEAKHRSQPVCRR
jgi:hypothetical protein